MSVKESGHICGLHACGIKNPTLLQIEAYANLNKRITPLAAIKLDQTGNRAGNKGLQQKHLKEMSLDEKKWH